MRLPMTLDDYIANPANRFATVAMCDTNGLLRGQMVSTANLRGIVHDPGALNAVSQTFRHFIGGMQKYPGDMTLLFLPTVNSCRRFAAGTFAPPGLTWGHENRTTCLRIVGHDAASLRLENRLPGTDTNPCLTVAATLAATLAAGIIEAAEPEAGTVGNGHARQAPRDFGHAMPEAVAELRGSAFARDWLGPRVVETFAASREGQYNGFRRKVPDVELERFFDLG